MTQQLGVLTNVGLVPVASAFTWRFLITSDGTATGTPTNLTGRTYKFVMRRVKPSGKVDNVSAPIFSTTSITFTSVNGTNDAADISFLSTSLPIATVAEGDVSCALWRTDDPNDRPEAETLAHIYHPAAQA